MADTDKDQTDQDEGESFEFKVINEASRSSKTLLLGFLASCTYIGIAVASTTDGDLLIGRHVSLPVIGAEIPLRTFFVIAPLLVLSLHFYLVLNEYFFSARLRASGVTGLPRRELFLEPSLLVTSMVELNIPRLLRWTLQILSAAVLMIVPVVLLLVIQIKFVAYHDAWITLLHQLTVLVDVSMLWWLVPTILEHRKNRTAKAFGIAGSLGAFVLCGILAVGPGNGFEVRTGRPLWFEGLVHRSIVISDSVTTSTRAKLSGRDLQRAKLKGIMLAGADLRNADLTGACLEGADLRRADLQGAKLRWADLTRARLDGARLESGDFRFATLSEARIRLANLVSADFRDATLENAKLSFSRIEGSDLTLARLPGIEGTGSSFVASFLVGTDLQGAKLWLVEMRGTDIRSSRFSGAELWKSEFVQLESHGKEFEKIVAGGGGGKEEENVRTLLKLALASVGFPEKEWAHEHEARIETRLSLQESQPPRSPGETPTNLASRLASEACRLSGLANGLTQSLFRSVIGCQNPFDDAELQRAVAEELLSAHESGRCPSVGERAQWLAIEMIVRGEDAASVAKDICGGIASNESSSCRDR